MFARTPRLTLRPGWPEDAPELAHAIAHESVAMKLARLPWPYTVDHAAEWLATPHAVKYPALSILSHDGDQPRLVGAIGLSAHGNDVEIGYWLTPTAWGHGYATEAGRAMLDIARHALGLRRLVSGYFTDNPASGNVLRKLGFRETGEEMRACVARGHDVACMTMELVFDDGAYADFRLAA